MPTPTPPQLITVAQAAELAGVSESSLRRLLKRNRHGTGDLQPAIVSAPGGQMLLRRQAFERWLAGEVH